MTGSAYFPLVVVFCQRYAKNTGVGTLVSLMLPYSVVFLVAWTTAGFDTERSIDVLVGRKFDDLVGSILILFFAERSKRDGAARRETEVAGDAERQPQVQRAALVVEQELLTQLMRARQRDAGISRLRRNDRGALRVDGPGEIGHPVEDLDDRRVLVLHEILLWKLGASRFLERHSANSNPQDVSETAVDRAPLIDPNQRTRYSTTTPGQERAPVTRPAAGEPNARSGSQKPASGES